MTQSRRPVSTPAQAIIPLYFTLRQVLTPPIVVEYLYEKRQIPDRLISNRLITRELQNWHDDCILSVKGYEPFHCQRQG